MTPANSEGSLSRFETLTGRGAFELPDQDEIDQECDEQDGAEAPNQVQQERVRPFRLKSGPGQQRFETLIRQKHLGIKWDFGRLSILDDLRAFGVRFVIKAANVAGLRRLGVQRNDGPGDEVVRRLLHKLMLAKCPALVGGVLPKDDDQRDEANDREP